MSFHLIQNDKSIARVLWRAVTAIVLFAIAPLGLAQQVLSPPSISFGNVPLTVPVTQTGTFSNNSTFQSVTITALSTSDARFAAVGSGGSPCNVGAVVSFGASCTYALTFTPDGTGAYNNTTSVAFDLAGVPQTPLTQSSNGTGFALPSTISPASLNFGSVSVNLATSQNFTFTNNSDTTPPYATPYTLTGFTTTGLGYSAVGSGATPCAVGLVLAPGTSCGATVTFLIAVPGASNGTTTIGFLAALGANPPYTQSIGSAGIGVLGPVVTVTGTTTFPNTTVGASSPLQTITITNSGGATLSLNSITHSNASIFPDTTGGPAPSAAHWCGFGSVAGGAPNTGSPINIAPGNSCALNLIFAPNAIGPLTGTITINSNATPGIDTITVSGTGVGIAPTITGGLPPNGTVGVAYAHTFSATGTAPIIWSIATGTLPAGVGLSATGVLSGTPTAAGAFTFTVQAANGVAPIASQTVTVTIAAAATPSMTVAFAPTSVLPGVNSTMTLTLANTDVSSAFISGGSIIIPVGLTATPPGANTCGTFGSVGGGVYSFGMGFIPASGSCTIDLTVQSATPGTYTATILPGALTAGAGANTNTSSATLTVTAAPTPAVTLTPATLTFGARTVNTTSPLGSVTLTNSGGASLVIFSIASIGDFGFTTTCPISTPPIAPAGTCTIDITFTPLTVAALTGSITITSDAPGSPHIITLSGIGSAVPVPGVSLSTTTLGFGNQPINISSAVQSISVTNSGFATLLISSITKTGSSTFTRAVAGGPSPDCAGSVAPLSTCYISVIFTPTAIGAATAQISIASNAGSSPDIVNLTGSGVPAATPAIRVASSVAFGDQIVATSTTQALTIFSTGSATLNLFGTIGGPDARSFTGSGTCTAIAPGANCVTNITFTPSSVGIKTAQLTIASDAFGQPTTTVNLAGNGILAPGPIVDMPVTAIGFGNTILGGATASQVVTLRNTGGLPLNIQNLYAVGDFVQMNSCPASLASGASCLVNVLFSPLGIGNRTGELVLVTNAPGSPQRIRLSGTGCRWFSQAQSRFFLTACGW